jgi:hypothetical protein
MQAHIMHTHIMYDHVMNSHVMHAHAVHCVFCIRINSDMLTVAIGPSFYSGMLTQLFQVQYYS